MKKPIVFIFVFILALTLAACRSAPAASPTASPVAATPAVITDTTSFVAALDALGAQVQVVDRVSQPFFSPEGVIVTVAGKNVQIFEYASAAAMEGEAFQVAADGKSVGTSTVNWVGAPHFYKSGRIIVIYTGDDAGVLSLLSRAMGPQFAGQ